MTTATKIESSPPEICRMLRCSISHLPEGTRGTFVCFPCRRDLIIPLTFYELSDEDRDAHHELAAIMDYAREQECSYILFEPHGPKIPLFIDYECHW